MSQHGRRFRLCLTSLQVSGEMSSLNVRHSSCNCKSSVRFGAADQRLYCYLLLCVVMCFSTGALGSEVSALAHRAAPATIEYHVIQPTWLHLGPNINQSCEHLKKDAAKREHVSCKPTTITLGNLRSSIFFLVNIVRPSVSAASTLS
jgi:hypothetical protein